MLYIERVHAAVHWTLYTHRHLHCKYSILNVYTLSQSPSARIERRLYFQCIYSPMQVQRDALGIAIQLFRGFPLDPDLLF